MRAILDTHAILWALEGDARLGKGAESTINQYQSAELGVASISLLEISMLIHKGKISIQRSAKEYLRNIGSYFKWIELNPEISSLAYELDLPHSDPFDRTIVATAKYHQIPLVTKDKLIVESGTVETIW
jgi:PIN domain nuclease of toxin-antitoxin system